jgi:hypothetical protein
MALSIWWSFSGCGGRPAPAPNDAVAYWVLNSGGTVTIREGGRTRKISKLKGLPYEAYAVVQIQLVKLQNVPAEKIREVCQLRQLTSLSLRRCAISDKSLSGFARLENLEELDLTDTSVTDAGLPALKKCIKLKKIDLSHTKVRGTKLSAFATLSMLAELKLAGCPLEKGVLPALKPCYNLNVIDVTETGITNEEIQEMHKLLKHCTISR